MKTKLLRHPVHWPKIRSPTKTEKDIKLTTILFLPLHSGERNCSNTNFSVRPLPYKQFTYDRIATYVKEIGLAKNEKPGVKFGNLPRFSFRLSHVSQITDYS